MLKRASVFVLLAVCLFAGSVFSQKWGKVTDDEWRIGPPDEYPEANAIVLFDLGKLTVTPQKIELSRHVRIKILTKAGIEEVGDAEFSYRENDKIKKLKAHTMTPDGKRHKVEKKEFYTKSSGSWQVKSFSFPVLDSGCIIEYQYTNVNERWHRLDPWYFQSDLYTLYSEFKLVLWPGFVYSSATMRVPAQYQQAEVQDIPNTDKIDGAPLREYTWRMDHLPPVKDEPYMSFRKNYLASLYNQLVSYETKYRKYKYIKDWKDMGESWQESLDNYVNKKKEIRKIVDSLTSGLTSIRDRAGTIYEYVVNEFEIGESDGRWWTNENLWEFVENKSGTEDEKSILLVEMLKGADIPAWPVLIGTRNSTVFIPRLCMEHQFNHMIAVAEIDSAVTYLDPSSKYCQFGILPPNSRVTGGLLIDGKESRILNIYFTNPQSYRADITRMHIGSGGIASCSTCCKFSGYYANVYGGRCEKNKPNDFVKEYFLDKLDVAYEVDTPIIKHERTDHLQMDVAYRLNDYVRKLDNNLMIKPIQYAYCDNPFKNEKRFFPVDFDYPFIYENTVQISIEDSILSVTMPEPVTLEIPGATFTRNCMFDGENAVINCRLYIQKPIFPQPLYTRLRDFFIDIASASEDEVIFVSESH